MSDLTRQSMDGFAVGEDIDIVVDFADEDGDPLDITGDDITIIFERSPDAAYTLQKAGTEASPTSTQGTFSLLDTDTDDLEMGEFEFQVWHESAGVVTLAAHGDVTVWKDRRTS